MDVEEKNAVIKALIECIGEAVNVDSDDSDKEDILNGLLDLCTKATYLPTFRAKKQLKRIWEKPKPEIGTYLNPSIELLLSDEASYKNYLKMSKTQFEFLLNLVEQDIKRTNTPMREAISAPKKLAVTLRFLATGESFRIIGRQSGISRSTFSGIVPEVCKAITKRLKETYMKFPRSPAEWEEIAGEFAMKWQFPNCIGALDTKHIYLRKDGKNSVNLMALVDANCKFISIDIVRSNVDDDGNDTEVFLQSSLNTVLEEETEIPPNTFVGYGRCLPFVVVADDAFPLQTHLMKPYPYNTNSSEEKVFNARLSHARQVADHALAILSKHFRIFSDIMKIKAQTVETITLTCCILHNFLLETDDTYITSTVKPPSESNVNRGSGVYSLPNGFAEFFRQQFMEYFYNEGKDNFA